MKKMTLVEINKEPGNGFYLTDKGTIHNYLPIYEALFSPLRDKELNIFEVGYHHGGSSKLWVKYFSKAMIKSIDIDNTCPPPSESRTTLEILDIGNMPSGYFSYFIPDIAIDDGSHHIVYQIHFFNVVYPVLKSGGLMIIEDVQDIDHTKMEFDKLGVPYELIDQRKERGIYDEVLLIFRKP